MAGKGDILKGALDFTAKLLSGEGDDAAKAGIRAYHGSPYSFDAFDLSKIGTGEGAQAYGPGLYFAENEGVAKGYRDTLKPGKGIGPEDTASRMLDMHGGDRDMAIEALRKSIDKANSNNAPYEDVQRLMEAKTILNTAPERAAGSMYEVNIDADPNAFLDWDKPLSEQPDILNKMGVNSLPYGPINYDKPNAWELLGLRPKAGEEAVDPLSLDGGNYVERLRRDNGNSYEDVSGREVSRKFMNSKGIPGIKYLDAGSRVPSAMAKKELSEWQTQLPLAEKELADATARGDKWLISRKQAEVQRVRDGISRVSQEADGTRNYVVFDDRLISIIRKYGIAGASVMLGYNLMEQLDPKQALAATMADEEHRAGKAEGGSVREGYAGKGRVIANVADEALNLAKRLFSSAPEESESLANLAKERGVTPRDIGEPFGGILPRVPYDEWRFDYKPTGTMIPQKPFDPESLRPGDVMIPLIGDRTANGRTITSIAGNRLEKPVVTEGGPDYMRGPSQIMDRNAWASDQGVVTKLNNRVDNALTASREAGYKDPNAYGVYVAMGPEGGDFSTHTAEALMGMLPHTKILKKDVADFDRMVRDQDENWPGLMKPGTADYIVNADAGAHRKAFVQALDSKYWREKGFPDASLARYATTTPDLVATPTEAAGYGVAKLNPGAQFGPITAPHRTYNTPMPGEYAGSMPPGVMRDDVFTQHSARFDANPPETNLVMAKRRSFERNQQQAYQLMREQDIQNMIDFMDKIKRGYADGGEVDDDVNDALRIARAEGGRAGYATDGTVDPQVFLTDAQGRQYDAQGKPIQPVATQEQSNSAATQAAPTPEQVGRRAAEDPATFDAMMQKYAIPDRDVAEYEALQTAVRKQPQEVQQMTHVGAPPMRDIKVDMPLFGGEYNVGQAPYNVAGPLETTAQTAYDFKTAPLYMTPMTAPIAAGLDVAEGVTTGDPLQASLAAFGVPGKYAKAAIIGASNYAMDPAQAEAGPARWFSKAMEIAREIPMNKMTGEQALAMLRKGTSPEEIRWTGADAFLQGKPTVTKEELVDYLNKNRLQLGEVRLGGEKPEAINYLNQVDKDILERYQPKLDAAEAEHKKALDYFHSVFGSEAEESAWQTVTDSKRDLTDLQLAAMQEMKDRVGTYLPTKYQDYSTSGGEGYAETLYTLGGRKKPRVENRNGMWSLVDENGNVMRAPHGGEYSYWTEGDANRAAGSVYRGSGIYQSGHWDQPDVLAHSRSQTLSYDPPGANRPYRVHNVDETQSDWGQAARKTGFYDPEAYGKWERDTKETKEAMRDLSDKLAMRADEIDESLGPKPTRWIGDEFNNYHERRQDVIAADPKIQEMRKQIEDYRLKLMHLDENKPSIRGVPNAPFIGSTEGWTDLAIKKQLDNALDSDADYFSWTPGQAQADRYDLSTHIGSVVYDPYYEKFNAYDPNGKHLVAEDMRDAARIDEYVGKELADKIRDMAKQRKNEFYDGITIEESPKIGAWNNWAIVKDGKPITLYGQKATGFPNKAYAAEFLDDAFGDTLKDNPIKLSGLDLKTGGEGMKGYYDKVYLKRVQDVIKKATGTKPEIEVIEVQTGDGPRKQLGVKLTDEMREKARFSDFNRGGTVTGPHSYGSDDPAVGRALALTREY